MASPSVHFLTSESMDEDEREASACIEKYSSIAKERGHSVVLLNGTTKCVIISCSDQSCRSTGDESVEQLVNNPVGADLVVILPQTQEKKAKVEKKEATSEDSEIADHDYPQLFFCHSWLLACHSGFFQSLPHFKEAHERVVEIHLPCSDQTSFMAMLALLYTRGASRKYLNPHTALGVCANLDYLAVAEPVEQIVHKYVSDHICAIVDLCESGGVSQHMVPFLKFEVMANAINLHLTKSKREKHMAGVDIVRLIEKGAQAARWNIQDLVGVFHEWASREPALSAFRELSCLEIYDLSHEISYSSMFFEHLFYLAKQISVRPNPEGGNATAYMYPIYVKKS